MLSAVIIGITMLYDVILNVIMANVVAPTNPFCLVEKMKKGGMRITSRIIQLKLWNEISKTTSWILMPMSTTYLPIPGTGASNWF